METGKIIPRYLSQEYTGRVQNYNNVAFHEFTEYVIYQNNERAILVSWERVDNNKKEKNLVLLFPKIPKKSIQVNTGRIIEKEENNG